VDSSSWGLVEGLVMVEVIIISYLVVRRSNDDDQDDNNDRSWFSL